MTEQLEKLIDLALADGVLTDKEKEVLYRKAKELNVDQDEFEMILDAKLHLVQKAAEQLPTIEPEKLKSNKEGDVKKCPSCGAPVPSFTTKCSDCGHEFRNTNANHNLKELIQLLEGLEIERGIAQIKSDSSTKTFFDSIELEDNISVKICNTIKNFSISNTKENVLEFLSWGYPRARKSLSWWYRFGKACGGGEENHELAIDKAWMVKCETIIMKARFSMKDDKKTLSEINHYAEGLKIK